MSKIGKCQVEAELELLPAQRGGRQSAIAARVYRPLFHINSHDLECLLDEIEGDTMNPGDRGHVKITVLFPEAYKGDLRLGEAFELKEGQRTVAKGTILKAAFWPD